jgi:hypothetical protein
MTVHRQFVSLLAACAALAVGSRPVTPQATIEVGPSLGYYSPWRSENATDGPNTPGDFFGRAVGGQITAWSAGRVGLRADAMVASKERDNTIPNPGGWEGPMDGHITMASLLVTYDVAPSNARSLWIAAGPGFVHHGGEAFKRSGYPTSASVVLGLGSTLPLGNALRVTFGASAFLYEYSGILGLIGGFPGLTGYYTHRFQPDAVLHASIAWNGK